MRKEAMCMHLTTRSSGWLGHRRSSIRLFITGRPRRASSLRAQTTIMW